MLINIAFCFDENLTEQVKVAVASLLDHGASDQVHYHIYCVCTKEAACTDRGSAGSGIGLKCESGRESLRRCL